MEDVLQKALTETVPISEIPTPRRRRKAKWDAIFSKIPEGEAIQVTEKDLGLRTGSVRGALRTLQEQGRFKNLSVMERSDSEGNKLIFIAHHPETGGE